MLDGARNDSDLVGCIVVVVLDDGDEMDEHLSSNTNALNRWGDAGMDGNGDVSRLNSSDSLRLLRLLLCTPGQFFFRFQLIWCAMLSSDCDMCRWGLAGMCSEL